LVSWWADDTAAARPANPEASRYGPM